MTIPLISTNPFGITLPNTLVQRRCSRNVFGSCLLHTGNMNISDLARNSNVTTAPLHPHSTQKLQQLDKSFKGPLKYFTAKKYGLSSGLRRPMLSISTQGNFFVGAYIITLTRETDANGIRRTRIFQDMEFSASELRQATTKPTDSRTATWAVLGTGRSQRVNVKTGP